VDHLAVGPKGKLWAQTWDKLQLLDPDTGELVDPEVPGAATVFGHDGVPPARPSVGA